LHEHMLEAARYQVALEVGPKRRVFAQALAWTGWCRSGKNEETALAQLLAVSERYAQVAKRAGIAFIPPTSVADFVVVERVPGTATTDFGGLGALLASDVDPLEDADIERLAGLLKACWMTFDDNLQAIPVERHELKPDRGRSPNAMRWHLIETDQMHASAFGPAVRPGDPSRMAQLESEVREHLLAGLQSVPRHEVFAAGRRYGFAWTPRFAVRRSAWHALDHAWELEDQARNQL
jgi:hypothetical protein